ELARRFGALARRLHLHTWSRAPDAGGGQYPLAVDLDHAGAAIAIGPVARLWQPAQMRDLDPVALRHLANLLARPRLDLGAVQRKPNSITHRRPSKDRCPGENRDPPFNRSGSGEVGPGFRRD